MKTNNSFREEYTTPKCRQFEVCTSGCFMGSYTIDDVVEVEEEW